MSNEIAAAIAERAGNYDISEFLQGIKDCQEGNPYQSGRGKSYDAGYGSEYEAEQQPRGFN